MPELVVEKALRFTPDLKVTILGLLLLPGLIALGFWQLDRAEEKRQLNQLFEQRQLSPALPFSSINADDDLRYQPVSVTGSFVEGKNFLLDNKIYKGRVGYELLSLFKPQASDRYVIINRGWIAGDPARQRLPEIKHLPGTLQLAGEIYVPLGEMMVLADTSESGWPRVIQQIDIKNIAEQIELNVFPYTFRLAENQTAVKQRNWPVVNIQPEKHTGYAFQWFAMAATVIIIMLLANTNLGALLRRNKAVQAD